MKKIDIAILLTLMIFGIALIVTGFMNIITAYMKKPAINCLYISDNQDPFTKKRFITPINIKKGYVQYITEYEATNSTTLHLFNLCYKKYENNTNK